MLGVTVFGLLLTPVFYLVIRALAERRRRSATQPRVLIQTNGTHP
jgi:multidrug efflux pump